MTIEYRILINDSPARTHHRTKGKPTKFQATETFLVAFSEAKIRNVGTVSARTMSPMNVRLASTAFVLATFDGSSESRKPINKIEINYAKGPSSRR